MNNELNIKIMTIPLVILLLVTVYLLMKVSNLSTENKHLKKRKIDAETTASIYFQQLIQYRDIIIRNNLEVPNNQLTTDTDTDTVKDSTFTVDGILDEIAEKGIENISKDKLDFLNKQNGENK